LEQKNNNNPNYKEVAMKKTITKFIKVAKNKDIQFVTGKMVAICIFIYSHPNFIEHIKTFFCLQQLKFGS
jgi:hypothetical protein